MKRFWIAQLVLGLGLVACLRYGWWLPDLSAHCATPVPGDGRGYECWFTADGGTEWRCATFCDGGVP